MKIAHGTTAGRSAPEDGASRFELAPPRRFILPAILLLLSEHPGYGYGLVPRLEEFHFGHVDRPAVYRALAQLETDGLVAGGVRGTPARARPGAVYSVTALGERVLRVWMGVIKEEHDYLGQALRRYQATGHDRRRAGRGRGRLVVGPRCRVVPGLLDLGRRRRPVPLESDGDLQVHGLAGYVAQSGCGEAGDQAPDVDVDGDATEPETATAGLTAFELDPERSAVLIDVRSTVGPLSFGTLGVDGHDPRRRRGRPVAHRPATFWTPHHRRLGSQLGQPALRRRAAAPDRRPAVSRRRPSSCASARRAGRGPGTASPGELTFHGVTRLAEGTVSVDAVSDVAW